MIKKYFKEEKAQKGEVINTKSGHQIRASVKISLVKLDPVSFFFSLNPLFCKSSWRRCSCLLEFASSVLTFHDPLS